MVARLVVAGLFCMTACAAEAADVERRDDLGSPHPGDSRTPPDHSRTSLLAWSFEPASADCNGWPVRGADAIRAAPARSGAYSCKVCSNGELSDVGLMRELGAVPPGRYMLTAWVRKRVQNAAPSEAVLRLDASVGGSQVSALAQPVAIADEWAPLRSTLDLAEPASNLSITIGAPVAGADRCLLVDDVVLERE